MCISLVFKDFLSCNGLSVLYLIVYVYFCILVFFNFGIDLIISFWILIGIDVDKLFIYVIVLLVVLGLKKIWCFFLLGNFIILFLIEG